MTHELEQQDEGLRAVDMLFLGVAGVVLGWFGAQIGILILMVLNALLGALFSWGEVFFWRDTISWSGAIGGAVTLLTVGARLKNRNTPPHLGTVLGSIASGMSAYLILSLLARGGTILLIIGAILGAILGLIIGKNIPTNEN